MFSGYLGTPKGQVPDTRGGLGVSRVAALERMGGLGCGVWGVSPT